MIVLTMKKSAGIFVYLRMINVAIPQEATPVDLTHFVADCRPVARQMSNAVGVTVVIGLISVAVAYVAIQVKNVIGKMADVYPKKNLRGQHSMIFQIYWCH